jgi:hypothetical protein
VLDYDARAVRFRHTDYDLAAAAARMRATAYPLADDFAAQNVLQVPTEQQALDVLVRAALR